jgi:hypothetical protein
LEILWKIWRKKVDELVNDGCSKCRLEVVEVDFMRLEWFRWEVIEQMRKFD